MISGLAPELDRRHRYVDGVAGGVELRGHLVDQVAPLPRHRGVTPCAVLGELTGLIENICGPSAGSGPLVCRRITLQ